MILSVGLILVYKRAMAEPNTGWVPCNDHYAIEIPHGEPFAHGYVKCENFDKMQELIELGKLDEAKKLVFR